MLPPPGKFFKELCFDFRLKPVIEGSFLIKIHLIEDSDYWLFAATKLSKGGFHHIHLVFVLWVGNIDYVKQDIAFLDFIERAFEAFDEVVGEFADESYCITQEEWRIFKNNLPGGCVQRGKKFVFCQHITFTQEVHDGRFTHIGVTYESYPDEFTAVFALGVGLFLYFAKFPAE